MAQEYYPGPQAVLEMMPDEAQHRRMMARAINTLMSGDSNAVLQVTLDPSVATTTVIDKRISFTTGPMMIPTTANAAAEVAAGSLYVVPTQGQCVIHHANNTQTDRTFQMALLG